jgi:hypothetical protein
MDIFISLVFETMEFLMFFLLFIKHLELLEHLVEFIGFKNTHIVIDASVIVTPVWKAKSRRAYL